MSLEFLMADRGSVFEEGEAADIETIRSPCRLMFVSGTSTRVRAGKGREVSLLLPEESLSSFSLRQICLASDTHISEATVTRQGLGSSAHAPLRGP